MGGNALNGLRYTRRFEAAEYHALVPEVVDRMRSVMGPGHRIAVLPSYATKTSFGDMDVLVELASGTAHEFRHAIAKAFDVDYLVSDGTPTNQLEVAEGAAQTVRSAQDLAASGKTYSFAFRDLQIDILPMTSESFDPCLAYFSYSDCGNLLGRVVHAFGMKLGQHGLLYPFKSGDHEFTELLVERDWKVILPAFGWKYETWESGFQTLEDIFAFVASSPFFNADVFQLHNRNAKSRVRDRKRTTYRGFLEWLDQREPNTLPAYPFIDSKGAYLPMLFERLEHSGFRAAYERTAAEFSDWETSRSRFNGEFVQSLTGLNGKDLSGLITKVRASMGSSPQEIQKWILFHSNEELEDQVHRTWSCMRAAGPRP